MKKYIVYLKDGAGNKTIHQLECRNFWTEKTRWDGECYRLAHYKVLYVKMLP